MSQPKALFLADVMHNDPCSKAHHDAAAFELRRLHAENESLRQIVQDFPPVEADLREVSDQAHRLEQQRDALLEALRWIDQRCPRSIMKHPPHTIHQEMAHDAGARARAAIKAVEGEKT